MYYLAKGGQMERDGGTDFSNIIQISSDTSQELTATN